MNQNVYILTGSNLGDRFKNLENALKYLNQDNSVKVKSISGIYESEAFEMSNDSPPFLNQAIQLSTDITPLELLNLIESIEMKMGRTDKGTKRSRTIDIDILLFDSQIIDDIKITIPHKELMRRPFTLVPLLELAPDIIHPVTNQKISTYLSVDDANKILLYKEYVTG
jgi:2-amino-4-hydroxy-6-hydroxymethyldihydropteridine diphosphokinase